MVALSLAIAGLVSVAPAGAAAGDQPTGLSPDDNISVTGIPALAWDRQPDATAYDVQVSTSPQYTSLLQNVTTTNAHFVPTVQLPSDADLYWHVRARYPGNVFSPYTEATFHSDVAQTPTPLAPVDGHVLNPPGDPVAFSWSTVPGATQYDVEVGTDPLFTDPSSYTTTVVKTTSYLPTVQQQPRTYYWRVRAEFGTGIASTWSDDHTSPWSYTVAPLPKAQLQGPADDPAGTRPVQDVVLDWRPVAGAATYDLQLGTDQNFLSNTTTVKGIRGSRYSPPSTPNNDQYYWRVRPVDLAGNAPEWGPAEDVWHFRRSWPDQPGLEYPEDGSTVGDPFFLQWTPVHLASSYTVQLSSNSSFSPASTVFSCTTTNTTYTPAANDKSRACIPAAPGTYYWRVIAKDDPAGVVSQAINASVRSFTYVPEHVTLATPSNGATVQVPTLTWDPVANAATYKVTVTSTDSGSTASSITTAATSFTPRALLAAGTYRWQVQPLSEDGRAGAALLPQSQQVFTVADQTGATSSTPEPTSTNGTFARFPTLTWSPVTGATRYLLRVRKLGAVAWDQVENGFAYPAGDDSGTTHLAPDTYEWYVEAYSGSTFLSQTSGQPGRFTIAPLDEVSGYRAALTGTALTDPATSCAAAVPSECQNLRQTPVLRWTPDPEAGFYQLYISRDAELTNLVLRPVEVYSTSWTPSTTLPDSNAGSAYYWYVQPCTAEGVCSPPHAATHQFNLLSNAARLRAPASDGTSCPLDPASSLPVCADDVTLSWQDYLDTAGDVSGEGTTLPTPAGSEAKQYHVQTSTSPQFTSTVDNAYVDQTTFTSSGTTYPEGPVYWRVQAVDGSGNPLTWSDTGTFVKRSPVPVPATPTSGASVTGGQPFSWEPLDFAASYNVEIYKNDDTVPSAANKVGGGNTKQAAYALTAPLPVSGVNYRWRVQRVDASGRVGAWSDLTPFTVVGAAPTLSGPTDGADLGPNDAVFSWQQVADAASYRFERRKLGTTTVTESRVTPALAWAPTTAITGGDWQWRVVAVDSGGKDLGASDWRGFNVIDKLATAVPTITGTGQVGTTLTSGPASWNLPGVTTSYQWYRGSTAVPGATSTVYDLTAADLNQVMKIRVTGAKPGYPVATFDSNLIRCGVGAAPALAHELVLSGSAKVGTVLSSNPVVWDQSGVGTTYQWLANGATINGATATTYVVKSTDVGRSISLSVTGALTGYAAGHGTSNTLTASGTDPLVASSAPKIGGTPRVGQTLTATTGTWPSGATYTYQWLRDGAALAGATSRTHVVTVADAGRRLSMRVTSHKATYLDGSSTSAVVTVAKIASRSGLRLAPSRIRAAARPTARVTVTVPGITAPVGRVWVYDGTRVIMRTTIAPGQRGHLTLHLPRRAKGTHYLHVRYLGSVPTAASNSPKMKLVVTR